MDDVSASDGVDIRTNSFLEGEEGEAEHSSEEVSSSSSSSEESDKEVMSRVEGGETSFNV